VQHKKLLVVALIIFSWTGTMDLLAYEGGSVSNGGTIEGVVKFKGTAPAPKKIQVSKDTDVCGKTAKTDEAVVVNSGAIEFAVVSIESIDKGKPMTPADVKLDQKDCQYHPHVLAFPAGSTLEVINPDGILHNIHSYSKVNSPFNFAQPKFKKTLSVKIDKPEVINIKCDVHNWMNGWLFSAANPYFSVTDAHGAFKLTDVPAGTYTVKVWQEKLGTSTQKVTVKGGQDSKIDFELAAK
jgi:plastocyanin